ncbi:MAG: SufS family cysteine desulfurase [Rhizobiales bacterium]|nr:SufS family cysteine desulfurase [Hyphomicrobiales bacterium]
MASVQAGYDVELVRAQFPILSRQVHGKPLVYLDNGASAQKPRVVLDAMEQVHVAAYANVHRGLHFLSNLATQQYEDAREKVAGFTNARRNEEVIFTKSATEAINLVAQSYGRANVGADDVVVLSIMEHHSNIVPWHFLRERQGARLKWAQIADDGSFLMEDFERLLCDRTKLVAITHMSNVLGTVTPIKEICRIAHARGIPVLVDGSQGAVHLDVDVQDLGCDFYVMTGHKLYGPTGIGVLWGRAELMEVMPPFLGGGEMIEHVGTDRVTYAGLPHRFEAGTPPIVQAIGLGAAVDFVLASGREAVAAHEADLVAHAHARLEELDFVTIHGTAPGKGSIVSFSMAGLHPHDVSTIIDRSGVAIRAGHHCAQPLMERLGVSATCRASFAMYNTRDEVDMLADALKKAHGFFA